MGEGDEDDEFSVNFEYEDSEAEFIEAAIPKRQKISGSGASRGSGSSGQ